MEMEDQEVEARSDAGTHASGRYTLALQKTMSFWPSSIILGAGETGGEVWGRGKHKKARGEH